MKIRHAVVVSMFVALIASVPGFAEQQTYKVAKGDSLYKIAKQFNTTPDALKELNGLKNNNLSVGWILVVSADRPAVRPSVKTAVNNENPGKTQVKQSPQPREEARIYKVRPGDTIYGIAKYFNLDAKDIIAMNNIRNIGSLKVGQVLTMPGAKKPASAAVRTAKIVNAAPAQTTEAVDSELAQAAKTVETEPAPAKTQSDPSAPAEETAAAARTVNWTNLNPVLNPALNKDEITARDRVVEAGFNLLGVRYRYGGTSEKTGLDCSALVKNVFEKIGFALPRTSREQYEQGEKVAKEDLQKGDLVFFSSGGKAPTHVGVYIGNNQFLHAASRARKVIISDFSKTWYDIRYLGARRIMELWWDETKIPMDDDALQENLTLSVPD